MAAIEFSSAAGRLLHDLVPDRIEFGCHLVEIAAAIGCEDGARRTVGQRGGAVGIFRDVEAQRRLDPRRYAGLQHADSKMGVEDHDHPVAGDGDTD